MRKWCPEPFDGNPDIPRRNGDTLLSFEAANPSLESAGSVQVVSNPRFEKDSCLTRQKSLWDLMNSIEKEQLLEDAQILLRTEFEDREKELRRRHRAEMDEARTENSTSLENWSREFSAVKSQERQEIALEAAGLALAVARKIIREAVEVDPEILTRTLETALFKVGDTKPLTVILHPEDAERLQADPGLMSRLRIGTVVPDRRVDKGGCRVRSEVREWDGTISGQISALTGIVEETLASAGDLVSRCSGGEDDPVLD